MFKPGRTFSLYVSHLVKAAILMHDGTDWMCPAIRSVARGLANAQNLSFRFQNYMFALDLLRLLRFVKLSTDLGIAAFMSFLLRFEGVVGNASDASSPGLWEFGGIYAAKL